MHIKRGAVLLGLAMACATSAHARTDATRYPQPPAEIADIPVALLVDTGSGMTLFARKPDLRFVPASMTKVMTTFVAFEEISAGRLAQDRVFSVRPETARLWNGRGTSMYLTANEKVSTHDLLRGIMTASANDAAVVLAESYAGNVPAWSFLMNDAARRLGMKNSAFNTPNGWPDQGKTFVSARDLVTLSTAMIRQFPGLYRQYSGKREMVWKRVRLFSHDPVTGQIPGADGIKTGYTSEAGYNFLGSAEREGRRLVMVLAGAKSQAQRAAASRTFLEWGFAAWQSRKLFPHDARVGNARVQNGTSAHLELVTREAAHATFPARSNARIKLKIRYKGPLVAPIEKGAQVAELEILTGALPPTSVPLYAGHSVARAGPIDRLMNGLRKLIS